MIFFVLFARSGGSWRITGSGSWSGVSVPDVHPTITNGGAGSINIVVTVNSDGTLSVSGSVTASGYSWQQEGTMTKGAGSTTIRSFKVTKL